MQSNTAIIYQVTVDDLETFIQQAVKRALQGMIVQPQPEPEIKYKTGAEVDSMLHITPMTRQNWVSKGILKKHKIGRRVLYRMDEVEAAMNETKPLKYRRGKVSR